jgi:hypothetical protein
MHLGTLNYFDMRFWKDETMFKICGFRSGIWGLCSKVFFVAVISISCGAKLFSEIPSQIQDPVSGNFVMMSDGKESKAVSIEEFFKVALKDAGKKNNKEEFENILRIKQNLDREALQASSGNGGGNRVAVVSSMRNSINSVFKDSFVVDTLAECFKGSGQAVKSVAKSVIKGVTVGATMGVVLLIGGAIVWQILVIPAYCKGPGPVIADWLPVSDYWGSGEDGVCQSSAQSNKILSQEVKLKRAAEIISASVPAVVLPDGSFNPEIPGYCKVENGKVIWCDKSLCQIDKNIRGC